MKKGNKSDLCPLCGGERKPATTTFRAVRASKAVASTVPETATYSLGAESSDDRTANDFAELLLNLRNRRV